MTTRLQKNVKQYFKDNIGIIGALLILCIFLSVFPKTSGSFLTQKNIFNVLIQIIQPVPGLRHDHGHYPGGN